MATSTNTSFTVGGTEQAYLITLRVDNVSYGTWDTFSGGVPSAKSNMHRPGGMGEEIIYVSLPTYSNVMVSRVLQTDRDWEEIRTLTFKTGRVRASVTQQPLDANGVAYGKSKTYSGRFISINEGKVDSQSDALRMVEVELEINAVA